MSYRPYIKPRGRLSHSGARRSEMPDDDDQTHDDVGYAKPPTHTRFRKGVSGNPRGRPKGRCNFATLLVRKLQEKVDVIENGKRRTTTKGEMIVERLVDQAASGDLPATRHVISLSSTADSETATAGKKSDPSDADQKVMRRLLEKLQKPERGSDDGNND